jgi:hypothetical protein
LFNSKSCLIKEDIDLHSVLGLFLIFALLMPSLDLYQEVSSLTHSAPKDSDSVLLLDSVLPHSNLDSVSVLPHSNLDSDSVLPFNAF